MHELLEHLYNKDLRSVRVEITSVGNTGDRITKTEDVRIGYQPPGKGGSPEEYSLIFQGNLFESDDKTFFIDGKTLITSPETPM